MGLLEKAQQKRQVVDRKEDTLEVPKVEEKTEKKVKSQGLLEKAKERKKEISVKPTVSKESKAPLYVLGRDFECHGDWRRASFRLADRTIGPVQLGLVGEHQVG